MIRQPRQRKLPLFLAGCILATAFAPTFFVPSLLTLGFFAQKVRTALSWKSAALYGFWFGLGFFTAGLYWIAIGVSVYIDDFWWAIPFALFGLPLILSPFVVLASVIGWYFREKNYYILMLSLAWVFFEWVRSWIFTGLPWNLLGYTLTFSDELVQLGSIIGTYGMSFLVIYLGAGSIDLLGPKKRNSYFILFLIITISALLFGSWRLRENPIAFTDIKIRIVQPSIPQSDKWDEKVFWEHLDKHVDLSHINTGFKPDIILWSEAAVTAPHSIPQIKHRLKSAIIAPDTILITGGISDRKNDKEYDIYTAMYAINIWGEILFEYHKAHLVPFGEYMPLRDVLPFKKLTPGLVDYTEGKKGEVVELKKLNLKIRPLICYEAIFPSESYTEDSDVLINITNDTWYGNSSGPYQHFQMARMRAVETGTPLLRAANSGISAIVDSLGRVISATKLGHSTVLDGVLPLKLQTKPYYSLFQDFNILIVALLVQFLRKVLDRFNSLY
jgi:apolipoprotein N-acyltransferase